MTESDRVAACEKLKRFSLPNTHTHIGGRREGGGEEKQEYEEHTNSLLKTRTNGLTRLAATIYCTALIKPKKCERINLLMCTKNIFSKRIP